MVGVADRVEEHFRLFNEAVRGRDWVPIGPFTGQDQIARAYAEQPPTDTMTCVSDQRDGAVADLTVTFEGP
jgi:hypothetical protein